MEKRLPLLKILFLVYYLLFTASPVLYSHVENFPRNYYKGSPVYKLLFLDLLGSDLNQGAREDETPPFRMLLVKKRAVLRIDYPVRMTSHANAFPNISNMKVVFREQFAPVVREDIPFVPSGHARLCSGLSPPLV